MLLLLSCAHTPPRTERIVGPATGPMGEWVEVPLDQVSHFNTPRLHARGDVVWMLVDDKLLSSEDHGDHWAVESTHLLSDVAPFDGGLLGWTGNADAPLMRSSDRGVHWSGRPTAYYEGDQIISTGAVPSPDLLRVFGAQTLAVAPTNRSQLLVSETPPEGFAAATFELSPAFVAYAKRENRSTETRILDVGAAGGELYACGSTSLFRSADAGRTWSQLPNPDGDPSGYTSCTFTRFDAPVCVSIGRSRAQRLWCAEGDAWFAADQGLFEETPKAPAWAGFTGLDWIEGSAQGDGRYFLAQRGANPYAPSAEALYVTTDLHARWSRVDTIRDQHLLDIATTSQAILALTISGDRLHLWRYVTARPQY